MPIIKIVGQIEFQEMSLLINAFGCRENSFSVHIPPLEGGFLAIFELIFVPQDHLGPVWQGQAKVHPGSAKVQAQIAIQLKGRHRKWTIITARVVVVATPLLETAMDKTELFFLQGKFDFKIFLGDKDVSFYEKCFVRRDLLAG